jgi:hypothetical protein
MRYVIRSRNALLSVEEVQFVMSKPSSADDHKGAVEGDRPTDDQHSNRAANRHVAELTREGGPSKHSSTVAQDRVGANADDPEVAQANEAGQTTDQARDEEDQER